MSTHSTADDRSLAQRQASGLRSLADMIEQNPDIAKLASYGLRQMWAFHSRGPEDHATLAVLALRYGATVTKDVSDTQYNLEMSFADGAVVVSSLAARELVCEKVILGTKVVTTSVPDPALLAEVPLVDITENVEQVEWVCRPLLAAEPQFGESVAS